jgi:hypothetical protein
MGLAKRKAAAVTPRLKRDLRVVVGMGMAI